MNITTLTHWMRRQWQRIGEQTARRERQQLARDLHDGVAQDLYAANLALAALRHRLPDHLQPRLDEVIDRQALVVDSLRDLVADRADRPRIGARVVARSELVEALSAMSRRELGADPVIETDPASPTVVVERLAKQAALALREMISNAVRHSGADMIVVIMDLDERVLRLSVVDDGRGVDAHPWNIAGHGLLNLQTRAHRCGGRFTWRSTPGVGTTARWVVPWTCGRWSSAPAQVGSAR